MSLETWLVFLGAVALIASTPGPNVLYVTTRSLRFGLGAAGLAMAGCLLALVLMLSASAAGLSALLLAVPAGFDALRFCGAAYLVYLGLQTWRAPVGADDEAPEALAEAARESAPAAVFRGGFLVGISNPKLLVFAAAFFPPFISPAAPALPQFALLVATFVGVELLASLAYALAARRLAAHLRAPRWRRLFNRVSGAVFVGFGGFLLRYRA